MLRNRLPLIHGNFAYSARACFRMGMSGSASFQSVRNWLYAACALPVSPAITYARPI